MARLKLHYHSDVAIPIECLYVEASGGYYLVAREQAAIYWKAKFIEHAEYYCNGYTHLSRCVEYRYTRSAKVHRDNIAFCMKEMKYCWAMRKVALDYGS